MDHTAKLPRAATPADDAGATIASMSARGDVLPIDTSSKPPTIEGYELRHIIGRGGMGVVWQARELRFDRTVALKVHGSDANDVEVAQLWS